MDLYIQDRVFATKKRSAFITLKDHKDNFATNPSVRVINPTKPEIGRISKKIFERIVSQVKLKTNLKQWKNSFAVSEWFRKIQNKQNNTFIQFDIETFYASITP